MKKAFVLLGCLLVGLLGTAICGQGRQQSASTTETDVLVRRVEGLDLEYVTTSQAFSKALYHSGTPGGIVKISNCQNDEVIQKWQPLASPLRDVLNWIVQADPPYQWSVEDGVVNVLPRVGEPGLLKTHITKFEVKDASSAEMALYKLLAMPEVKASVSDFNLNEGIKAVVIPIPLTPNKTRHTVQCSDVTLRDALNTIARLFGNAVWAYREQHCAGKDEFSIDFIVQ
jgi:hypothetical protein